MLEAYKKFLLVTLIVHGDKTKDMTSLPKYTSPVINKYVKPLCSPYQELVVAYYSNQTADLEVNIMNFVYSGVISQMLRSLMLINEMILFLF